MRRRRSRKEAGPDETGSSPRGRERSPRSCASEGGGQHTPRSTPRRPNRQGKTVSLVQEGVTPRAHRPGHSRTKSETGAQVPRSRGGRHKVRRQSPVEERLSVHESDSMSDAFDDDGLFQIDENFAKFLDDKTSCQK